MCAMPRSYVWYDLFICVVGLTFINGSCYTCEWVMSFVWMSGVPDTQKCKHMSGISYHQPLAQRVFIRVCHVTQAYTWISKSRTTYSARLRLPVLPQQKYDMIHMCHRTHSYGHTPGFPCHKPFAQRCRGCPHHPNMNMTWFICYIGLIHTGIHLGFHITDHLLSAAEVARVTPTFRQACQHVTWHHS